MSDRMTSPEMKTPLAPCPWCDDPLTVKQYPGGEFVEHVGTGCVLADDGGAFTVEDWNRRALPPPEPVASGSDDAGAMREAAALVCEAYKAKAISDRAFTEALAAQLIANEIRALPLEKPEARAEGGGEWPEEPREVLAGRLIDAWCADKGKQIPWAKAIQIVAIVTKQSDEERDRLLKMGDEDGSCEMCGRSDSSARGAGGDGWIAVGERLPELKYGTCSDDVLCIWENGDIQVACYSKPDDWAVAGQSGYTDPTHWMPLPLAAVESGKGGGK